MVDASVGRPQPPQNFASGSFVNPQFLQVVLFSRLPHALQKR
jgi:hypothetical protein